MADKSKLGKERFRFMALIALGLIGAAVQLFFVPERLPQLPQTFAEKAYLQARANTVQLPLSALNENKWQQAQLVYPGDDGKLACAQLGEARSACEAVFAKPPREVVLLGMSNGKLARIEQVPATLVDLRACGRSLQANQLVSLSRNPASLMAAVQCQGA